jgi:uncharacterized protein
MSELVKRGILPRLIATMSSVPVVIVEGPRASGKTSIGALLAAEGHIASRVDLSEPTVGLAARNNPTSFIDGLTTPAFIDEAQLIPELLLAIKLRVDRERTNGLFVLTGSSRLGRAQLGGSDPLAGRAVRLRVWPMTQGELAGKPKNLAGRLTQHESFLPENIVSMGGPKLTASELIQRISRGGLPTLSGVATATPKEIRPQLCAEYVEAVLHHEVGGRHDRAELLRLFRYLAASTSRLLNTSTVGSELGVTRETTTNRLSSLEASFLLHLLPGHRPAEHRTLSAHPKVHAIDVGLASWAARLDSNPPAAVFGGLVETFVVNELAAQSEWGKPGISLRHWRDTTRKLEVDAVLVDDATEGLVGIEVKASADVTGDDLRGLRHFLASVSGAQRGVIFYSGERPLQVDDNIWALPISAMWHSGQ